MIHHISRYRAKTLLNTVATSALLVAINVSYPTTIFAVEEAGKQLFQDNCTVCHTIGGGRLVGPDLKDVHQRRSQAWLQAFIKSPQAIIDGGDEVAVALFKEFNNMPMPNPPISAQQIDQILQYLDSASGTTTETISETDSQSTTETDMAIATDASPQPSSSEEDIILGRNIFQGLTRLTNSGPACNSCHDVKHDAVIGGGILARELTSVFSRMGGPAVRSILGSAPFPVMKTAYLNKPLSKQEISALVAFFQDTDQQQSYQHPRDYGIGLLISGVIGAGLLLIFYSLLWSRRKKNSVNQDIYDRQIKSE